MINDLNNVDEEIERFNTSSQHFGKYLFNYSFLYAVILFILFKINVIQDSIFLNWLSNIFSYFIPLIEVYVQKYHYYKAANVYSLLILGLLIFSYKAITTKWFTVTSFWIDMKRNWSGFRSIFIRLSGLLLFGFCLWVALSEIFVSVQFTCTDPNVTNRACLGKKATPLENGYAHLFLLIAICLNYALISFLLINPIKPKNFDSR